MTRTLYVFLAFFFFSNFLFSQNEIVRLMGTSTRGGANNSGSLFSLSPDGSQYSLEHSFEEAGPSSPLGNVMVGSDGKLYGTASGGGEQNFGIVFSMEMDGSDFTAIHSFGQADGANPYSTLIEDSNGTLFGSTMNGGTDNAGVLFSISKDGSNFTVLHEFDDTNGAHCFSGLAEGSDGILYGMTQFGGDFGEGTIFRIAKDGTGFALLRSLQISNGGGLSYGQFIEDATGFLYGTFAEGGDGGAGGVFRIKKDGTGYEVLKYFSFSTDEGSSPLGTLLEASNGKLYGTTASGGPEFKGTVFSLNKDGSDFSTVYAFLGEDGSLPLPGNRLIEASDGMLYGANYNGGISNLGTIYKVGLDGSNFSKIFDFEDFNGRNPYAGVIEAMDGKLYGATSGGGEGGRGTVFTLEKDGMNYAVLHEFSIINTDGVGPRAKLLQASDGWLYGTANSGGNEGFGTIFRHDPTSAGTFETIYSLNETTGTNPTSRLLEGSDGKIYGTTSNAGMFDWGTIFKLDPDGSNLEVIYHFSELTFDGARPLCGLIEGSDGLLYGTTASGGEFGGGSVFRIGKDGTGYAQLFSFDFQESGASPSEVLLEASDGVLYGVTPFGGMPVVTQPSGTVFRINKDGTGYDEVFTFDREANGYPSGPLTEGPDGFLYGNTTNGAAFETGATYRIAKNGSGFEMLFEFDVVNGTSPQGELLLTPDGNWLYGVTRLGGSMDSGVVFRISPEDGTFEKILEFEGNPANSSVPDGGLVWVELPSSSPQPIRLEGLSLAPNPANSYVSFVWEKDFNTSEQARASISNSNGQLIFQAKGNLPSINNLLRAHSIGWQPGLYFVEVEMNAGVFSEKLILQR